MSAKYNDSLLFDEIESSWAREYPSRDLRGFLMAAVLMRMGGIVEKDFSQLCSEKYGIIGPEMILLFALRRLGPPYAARPAHLKRTLLTTSGGVTKQIDRLGAKGLVKRQADQNSRNGQVIHLTAAGRQLVDRAATMLAQESIACKVFASVPEPLATRGTEFCHTMINLLEMKERAEPSKRPIGIHSEGKVTKRFRAQRRNRGG